MEQLIKKLTGLYSGYGYTPYAMSKFEEYELYLRNKDFLISDRVLTFTDTDGKLMALKPDVTLSIIKNARDTDKLLQKIFYTENVYRPGKSGQGFREIMQVGLECMGAVDSYCVFEVLLLAVKSLRTISEAAVLDLSHMGLLSRLLDKFGLTGDARSEALEAIGEKNAHQLRRVCPGEAGETLASLAVLSGKPAMVMPTLETVFGADPEFAQFCSLLKALDAAGVDCVNVDFSVVNDMNYYNGIVFRGFVEGVPTGVLSGGEYDGLMAKMKRTGKAIGFALYPDLLDRLNAPTKSDGVDVVLLYDEDTDLAAMAAVMDGFVKDGLRVSAQPGKDVAVPCKKVCRLNGKKVQWLG